MSTLWFKSLSKTPISKAVEIIDMLLIMLFDILWIICNKTEKYRK